MSEPRAEGAPGVQGLLDALAQVSFRMMGVLTRLAAEEDLSLTQLRTLAILRDRQPRMADLADVLGLDRSTVTGLISRAEQRGLLRRVPAAGDARSVEVVLTGDGRELAERLTARMTGYVGRLTQHVSDDDRRLLEELLDRLLHPPAAPSSRCPGSPSPRA